jgi:hypothetical protein
MPENCTERIANWPNHSSQRHYRRGDYSKTSIPHMMIKTYLYPFEYYLHPTTFHPLAAVVLNIIVMFLLVSLFVKVSVMLKLSWQNRLFALLLFPCNTVWHERCLLHFKGFKHELMSFAFYLPFVFALSLQELSQPGLLGEKAGFASGGHSCAGMPPRVCWPAVLGCSSATILFSQITYTLKSSLNMKQRSQH